MNMSYKICFVCTGNACRSPFAECVMKKRLSDAGMDNIEVFSVGTLDWGKNPRDAVMTDVAKERGYELTGITTRMTRDRLMEADSSSYLTNSTAMRLRAYWTTATGTESSCSTRLRWTWMAMWKTRITSLPPYIAVWRST